MNSENSKNNKNVDTKEIRNSEKKDNNHNNNEIKGNNEDNNNDCKDQNLIKEGLIQCVSDKEINKIIEKENDRIYAKQLAEQIVDEIINCKEYEISPNNEYKVEYYKGNIYSLINELKSSMPLEKIDDKIKITFELENNLYNEDSYLKGQYPQVIICRPYKKLSEISAICSFYYQNYKQNDNILKINIISAINENSDVDKDNYNDLFEQFITMINFIKNYVSFDELYITLNYNKINLENKKVEFYLEKKILEFFKIQLGFKWVSIENIKGQKRKQQLCYKNNNYTNSKDNNNKSLNSETLYLLSFIKRENYININCNYNYFKYMNNLPIYAILTSQKGLLFVDFKNNKYRFDSSKLSSKENPIITLFLPENKNIDDFKSKLNNEKDYIFEKIEDSLLLEYYNKYKDNQIIFCFGLFKMNLNIFFQNILITNINNYYFNRISSKEVEIIRDKENCCIFYNLPSLNKINNILIFELNDKIRKNLIDNNMNVYELFINYYIKIKEAKENNEIIKSISSKNIYFPSFKIETHLQTGKVSKEINNINLGYKEERSKKNIPIKIGTIDEYLKIDFNSKNKAENQIIYELYDNNDEKSDKDIIINKDFIIGIINNFIDIKFPLFQLMYITKDYWIRVMQKIESK